MFDNLFSKKPESKPIPRSQVPSFLSTLHGRDALMFTIGLNSGISLGELAALRWADVDYAAQSLRIWGRGGSRMVVMPRQVFEMLKKFEGDANDTVMGASVKQLEDRIAECTKGFGTLTWHSIRLTYLLAARDVLPITVVAQNMGVLASDLFKYYMLSPEDVRRKLNGGLYE